MEVLTSENCSSFKEKYDMFILVICCGYMVLIMQKKKKNSWKPFYDSYVGPQSLVDNWGCL